MKKAVIVLLIALVVAIGCIYLFIPPKLLISKSVFISMSAPAVYRHFANDANISKWWIYKDSLNNSGLTFQNNSLNYERYIFHCTRNQNNAVEIRISRDSHIIFSQLNTLSIGQDSCLIRWECSLQTSSNPIIRLRRYLEAHELKETMTAVINKFSTFIRLPDNVYGMQVETTSTTDTLLMVAVHKTDHPPSIQELYQFLEPIKNYIYSQGALSTGYPMMNRTRSADSVTFITTLALPVNKVLKNGDSLALIHMVPGHFLSATVKGGPFTIEHQMQQLYFYMQDHQQTIMAIPFEILVTDRRLEPDTLNWITRLYLPVMH